MAAVYTLLLSIVLFYLSPAYGQFPPGYSNTFDGYLPEVNNLPLLPSSVPPAVGIYIQRFKQEVQNSSFLRNLFDIEDYVNPDEFYLGEFHTITCCATDAGTINPTNPAAIATQYLKSGIDRITPDLLINVHATAMAKYLDSKGALNQGNAERLATLYREHLVALGSQMVSRTCRRTHLSTIIIAVARILDQLHLYEGYQIPDLAEVFSAEWGTQSRTLPGVKGGNRVAPNQCTGEDPFLGPDDSICAMRSRAIDIFYNTLLRFVKSSDSLNEMFSPIPGKSHAEYNTVYFFDILYWYYILGGAHPGDLAAFTTTFMKSCTSPTFETLFAVRCLWIAKFFDAEGIMNENNAESLALSFGNTLVQKRQAIYNPDYPLSRIIALMLTARDLLVNAGTIGPQYGERIALYLGNEWRCQCDASSKG